MPPSPKPTLPKGGSSAGSPQEASSGDAGMPPDLPLEILPRLSLKVSRRVNAGGILVLGLVLALTTVDQMHRHDVACTLCIMQRITFIGIAVGLSLNLRFGARVSHYVIAILSAVAGAMIAARQVLMQITPDLRTHSTPPFEPVAYSWAVTLFASLIAGGALLMLIDRQPAIFRRRRRLSLTGIAALFVICVLTMVNGLSTLVECGAGSCTEEPSAFRLLYEVPALPPWLDHLAMVLPH